MHERKAMMAEMSDGFLVLPGGFGTLEEVVEALTWLQLGIHRKPVVFIDTLGFWGRQMAMFDHMTAEGLLQARDARHGMHRARPRGRARCAGILHPAGRAALAAAG